MSEWETLRRLLGLPADTPPPSPEDLTRLALENPKRARLVGMALRRETSREGPVAIILGALDRGNVDSSLGVELLGCIGHPSGYGTALRALIDKERPEAASIAGVAMARILGARAAPDLLVALARAEGRAGREGAALGLAELGERAHAEFVIEAARQGTIGTRLGARCVARLPFEASRWLTLLENEVASDRRLATEVVYLLVRRTDQARLDALGEAGRAAVRRCLDDAAVYMRPEKRDVLATWVED